MAMKDWKKSSKYNTKEHTIYYNIQSQYKSFHDNYNVSVGRVGMTPHFYVMITKDGRGSSKEFNSHKQALTFARRYMRTH